MRSFFIAVLLSSYLLVVSPVSNAYTPDEKNQIQVFLSDVFAGDVPVAQRLWLSADLKTRVQQQLHMPLKKLSYRYWQKKQHRGVGSR
jgi:hypothetical protein